MKALNKRVERQRALVAGLRQRLAFELLVLERLECRAQGDERPNETRTLGLILRDARRRAMTNRL